MLSLWPTPGGRIGTTGVGPAWAEGTAIGCVPGRARFQEVTLWTGMVSSGGGDAGFVGDHNKLGAVASVQFAQEPTDMSLDSGDAEVQVRSYLGV